MNQPHAPDARPPGVDERVEIDLSAILGALRRSLRWLLPLVVGAALVTFLVLQVVPSRYRAESKVLIETSNVVYPGEARGAEEERALLDNEGVAARSNFCSRAICCAGWPSGSILPAFPSSKQAPAA